MVYQGGLESADRRRGSGPTEISVRQTPSEIEPGGPGFERLVRVTVVPSEPGLRWRLYLRDFERGPGQGSSRRVWWRIEPGTWQPLGGTRQCVAEGRGRVRLDVALRLEAQEDEKPAGSRMRLRFVAEST